MGSIDAPNIYMLQSSSIMHSDSDSDSMSFVNGGRVHPTQFQKGIEIVLRRPVRPRTNCYHVASGHFTPRVQDLAVWAAE